MAELTLREQLYNKIRPLTLTDATAIAYADSINEIYCARIKTMGLTQTEIFTAQNEDACSFVAMQEHKVTAKAQLDKVLKELN